MFAESNTLKQLLLHASLQTTEPLRCLKIVEFLSVNKCSHTRVDTCWLVSPINMELHPAHLNLYTT